MKTIGIIAEYNPFHMGHLYQIKTAKESFRADYVVVVMSGDFTQRGTPAIFDKYARAKAALSMGADLIIELPTIFATASAEEFAYGAIRLLDSTRIVDEVVFGCEDDDLGDIIATAKLLIEEPAGYQNALKEQLKNGISFAKARDIALKECGCLYPMDQPNNILAVEYVKALLQIKSTMRAHPMKRIGEGYHSNDSRAPYASATSIRSAIENRNYEEALTSLPQALKESYQTLLLQKNYVLPEDTSLLLHEKLLAASDFTMFLDSSVELSNKILHSISGYAGYASFCETLTTKNYSKSRICRLLCHILLGITEDAMAEAKALPFAPYLHILGCRESATPLLSELKKRARAPVMTSVLETDSLDAVAMRLQRLDVYAGNLYGALLTNRTKKPTGVEASRRFLKV